MGYITIVVKSFSPRHMGCDLASVLKKSLLGCQALFSFFILAMYFDAESGGAFGVIVSAQCNDLE
jgi:hypothetical protein